MSRLILLLLGIYFFPLGLMAQSGQIVGTVTDAKTEETLIGVTVVIEGTQNGATTDLNGYYKIDNLEPGSYNVSASYVGFESVTKYNVVVKSGGNPDVNFQLKETVEELEGVVVEANPFSKSTETPLSIQRLSREEVATYPGGNNDIAKVVQSLPGVSGSIGGFRNDVIIRGGAPNENVYYLDGIEIPNINHFATQGSAGGPVGLLNVSFFEGVTLSTSAFPAQYDNALSGVLQFDQRNGNDRNFKTNIRISGSEAAVTTEGPLFKGEKETSNTTFIASVRRSYLQLLFQLIDLPFLPDYWDYQYKISHKFSKYDELIVTGVGSIDDFAINAPEDFDPEQQATLDQIPIIQQKTFTSGVSWKHRFRDFSGFTQTTLSTNILSNQFEQYENNVDQTGLYFSNDSREWETKLRHQYNKFVGDWTFAAGGTVQLVDYQNTTTDEVNGFTFSDGLQFIKYGVHGQVSRELLAGDLSFSGGFRMDGNTFTSDGNEVWQTFSPRISASYVLDDAKKWTINASWGRYFKLPPYTILGFRDTLNVMINQNVDYIRSDHTVFGVEYLLTKSSRVSVEGFYKKYKDYPVSLVDSVSLANLGGGFEVLGNEPIASAGLGRTYGVEFLYQQKFTGKLYGILAVTLYRSEFTGFDQSEYLPSTWDSGQLITFTGGYKFGNNWEFSLRTRYLGKTPYAPVDQQSTLENYPSIEKDYDRLGNVQLDPFFQLDVRIDKKFNFSKWTLDIFLDVQNALGSDLPSEPSFGLDRDQSGQVITPRQLIQIEEVDNSSVLPTLGIVVDF